MTTMSIDRFADRLDALGSDFSRWPEPDAAAARTLLLRSPEARAAHEAARRLAALVAEAARAEAPNGLAFRVVADVAARRRERFSWLFGSPGRFGLAGASFCGAAVAAGVALAMATAPVAASSRPDLGVGFEVSLLEGDL